MKRVAAAVGSSRQAQEVAEEYLRAGGDAVGAAVSGFFAAAGQSPGVLFGPVGLLIAQVGVGVRAFDGRTRQPGLTLRRPRGLAPEETPTAASRVAAPSGIAALSVALRYGQSASLSKVIGPGVDLAKQAGSEQRAAVLEQIARLGAAALSAPGIARELIHVAGASVGGNLGAADLAAIPDVDRPARSVGSVRRAPWSEERLDARHAFEAEWRAQAVRQQGLCVCDARGGVAALCYDEVLDGLRVEALELLLPLTAIPPRRGVARIAPGQMLPAPTPLVIDVSEQAIPLSATVHLEGRASLVLHQA